MTPIRIHRVLGVDLKAARTAWTWALTFLLIFGAYLIHRVLFLFALALMLAYLFYPLVERIDRRLKWKTRVPSALSPFVLVLISLTLFGLLVRPQVRTESEGLREQIRSGEFRQRLEHWRPLGIPLGETILADYDQKQLERQIADLLPQLRKALGATGRAMFDIMIVPILSFFLLKDGPRIRDSLIGLLLRGDEDSAAKRDRRRIIEGILRDAHVLILDYMRALLLLSLATLISFSIVLKLLRVKYAVLLALLAFPLEFVPVVGPITAGVAIFAVSDFMGYEHMVWIVAFLVGFRIFQDYVLSPQLMHKTVKLHPLLVVFGVLAGGEIRGVPGIFLSVPILAFARLLFYEWLRLGVGVKPLAEAETTVKSGTIDVAG
jgi:predicted PurR-regulated permease PerM